MGEFDWTFTPSPPPAGKKKKPAAKKKGVGGGGMIAAKKKRSGRIKTKTPTAREAVRSQLEKLAAKYK